MAPQRKQFWVLAKNAPLLVNNAIRRNLQQLKEAFHKQSSSFSFARIQYMGVLVLHKCLPVKTASRKICSFMCWKLCILWETCDFLLHMLSLILYAVFLFVYVPKVPCFVYVPGSTVSSHFQACTLASRSSEWFVH